MRLNAPNDPDFDACETDNIGGATCSNVFDEELERFGFAPSAAQATALYKPPFDAHVTRLQGQNTLAGRNPLGQVSGVSADRAWKRSIGRPDVEIAILDTGIRWNNTQLRKKIALNEGELPTPQTTGGAACAQDDCNGDGAFDVDDFANDPRVSKTAGDDEADSLLDASDLIATFSGDGDDDGNGYADDIAGWDFFEDDNDPYDASSYSSAENHGSGRAAEAGAETNEGAGGTGVCPRCQIVPLRVWDTFVVDTDNFGQAVLYAGDNHIEVVEGASGGLFNSRFARAAFDQAYRKGTFFAIVSSDLNTSDHNIPTLYDEAMQVQGSVSDVEGLGQSGAEVGAFLGNLGIPTSAPIGTWFRNSGTTQYGGHAHIVMPAVTGSQATGQAAGAAGLVASYGRQKTGAALEPNEIKQLLTMTAEDVVPQNTAGTGVPDPAQVGWDQHFGYGRPDLGLALERIDQGKIPPEALITGPQWFAPLNLSQQNSVQISGRLSAKRAAGYTWTLQWAPGIEPTEADFHDVNTQTNATPLDGTLGTIDLTAVRAALDARPGGGATTDATAPAKGPGDKDPNEPAFTVRVVVTDSSGNRGEDRKVLFDYRDTTLHSGWSRKTGTGGEASQRLFDLDGDNALDIVQADSSGELSVLKADGTPLPSFNGGQPVRTQTYANVHPGAPSYAQVAPPREVLRTPAIGDIDGDLEPEIVDSAGEHVYAWNADGSVVPGFPVRLDPSKSTPALRTRDNHIKRGFTASPTLGDLVGGPALEIVVPGLDGHVYAWSGQGNLLPGFPSKLRDPTVPGAEIINTAAVGNIAGDSRPEIVVPTAEFDPNPTAPGAPAGPVDLAGTIRGGVTNILANALGGSGRVYALGANGSVLPGWPIKPNGAVPDALPLVGPGVDHVLANVDSDPLLEVIGNVATGDVEAHNGDGSLVTSYDSTPPGGENVDKSHVLNLFENPIVADLDSTLPGPEVIKGGLTLNQLVNLGVAVGQNLPYNHVVQAWNGQTGVSLPAYPQAVEDYQLLSSPAVADVSSAAGKEVLVGTGLYYLRDINSMGEEGAGWPKFTGGWLFGVPAVGDVDGDGNLEVSALTREGYSFLWDTDKPACGTNDEWWTSRHDEWSTGAYGTDSRPPGTPRQLGVTRSGRSVTLSFTAPGDDWLCGTARRYRIVKASGSIQDPGDGTVVGDFDADASAGQTETHTVADIGQATRVAVLYQDAAGNWGRLASAAVPAPHAGFLFGRGSPGTSFSATSGNVKRASRFFLYFPATVSALTIHADGNGGGTGSQKMRGIIYADAAGQPGKLLNHTFEGVVSAGAAASWVRLQLPFQIDLKPGYYWLGIQSGLNHNVTRYSWAPQAQGRRYNLDSYLDGAASPFGAPITDDQSIAIHALGY